MGGLTAIVSHVRLPRCTLNKVESPAIFILRTLNLYPAAIVIRNIEKIIKLNGVLIWLSVFFISAKQGRLCTTLPIQLLGKHMSVITIVQ